MANTRDKEKIVALQRMVKIARDALQKIEYADRYRGGLLAEAALSDMLRVEIEKGLSRQS